MTLRTRHRHTALRQLLCLPLLTPLTAAAVSLGQIDNFSDGTLQGWQMGKVLVTNNHLSNIAAGGPAGMNDNYLQVISHQNETTSGNKITFFNKQQWAGNYTAGGITTISMDLKNFTSSAPLNIRLAINGGHTDSASNFIGGLFATTASVTLTSGGAWTHAVFSLAPGDLVPVSGNGGTTGNDVNATLANVLQLRLLNSPNPAWAGSLVSATLGVDNITAVPLPPAAMLFATGLIGLGGAATCRRRMGDQRSGNTQSGRG